MYLVVSNTVAISDYITIIGALVPMVFDHCPFV